MNTENFLIEAWEVFSTLDQEIQSSMRQEYSSLLHRLATHISEYDVCCYYSDFSDSIVFELEKSDARGVLRFDIDVCKKGTNILHTSMRDGILVQKSMPLEDL